MAGAPIDVERQRILNTPAAQVWRWMCADPALPLFRANFFHASASASGPELEVGSRIQILHRFGPFKEARQARISTMRAPVAGQIGEVAWSEFRTDGEDWFPHSQRFALLPLSDSTCRLTNTLRGTFRLRGARLWLLPWYRHVLPLILAAENRTIARGCAIPGPPEQPTG